MQWLSNDGVELYAQKWDPDSDPKALICLVHGLGEHSGRYRHWAEKLNEAGYALLAFDLRGHGKSGGPRGDTPSFDHFADDLSILLTTGEELYPGLPRFLYGHSLGGLITLYYLIQRQPSLKGSIVTSPGLRTMVDRQKFKIAAARILGTLIPKASIPNGLDLDGLCRDEQVVKDYIADPLVHDRVSLRLGKKMFEAITYVFGRAADIKTPLLLMHGNDDWITFPEGSEEIAESLTCDKELKICEGCYHELHNEPNQDEIFQIIKEWLDRKLAN